MRPFCLMIAAVCLLPVQHSHAQTCLGASSFASGPVRLGAGLSVSDGAKGYGATLAAGSTAGPFGSIGITRAEYDDIANAGTAIGLEAGYAIDLTPAKTVQFCPVASFAYQAGPDYVFAGTDVSVSMHAFAFGGSLGGTVPVSPTLDFVPFAQAAYTTSRVTATAGGESAWNSEDYASVGIGAGFVLNKRLTLQPAVFIPVGLEGGKSTFQLAFAFNVGATATAGK